MSMPIVFLVFVASGLAGGLLLGLIGVGMALIAVPLLTLTFPYLGVPAEIAPISALATSMALVSVGSFSSIYSHHKFGNVDWKLVGTIVPASLTGVALGSLVASHLPGEALKLIFCAFLVIIAVQMLLPRHRSRQGHRTTSAWQYRLAGGLIGIAGSLIGAGGGIFMVPFLNNRGLGMPKAVAVSTTVGLPVTVVGSLIYAIQPSPAASTWMLGYIVLPAFLGLSLGSVVAAPIGAKLASRVPGEALKKVFAMLLLVLAVKMVV